MPWTDLSSEFGEWGTVYRRFNLWSGNCDLSLIFNRLSRMSDLNGSF
ncbi:hypothetical protein M5252_004719 [Vibrio parahaemolyticus]|nr:hypothetical protein [Vibrio parahaemolyticus]EJE8775160.1 hypothetical protein [Vibrio parahaemolyticus]